MLKVYMPGVQLFRLRVLTPVVTPAQFSLKITRPVASWSATVKFLTPTTLRSMFRFSVVGTGKMFMLETLAISPTEERTSTVTGTLSL